MGVAFTRMLEDDQIRNDPDTLLHLHPFFSGVLNGRVDMDMIVPQFGAIMDVHEPDGDTRSEITRQEDL